MSTGSFQLSKYELDDETVRPIRVQPETITTWNPAATGTSEGSLVRVSGGRRRIGLKARSFTLKQNVGDAVDGYQPTRSITLPIFTRSVYDNTPLGTSVQYQGTAWTVSGKSGQSGR